MNRKTILAFLACFVVSLMAMQMTTTTHLASGNGKPAAYFEITLIAPTNNPARVQHSQIIAQELWKIGIQADLILVGWDILIPRLFENVGYTTYEQGGFDIGFVGWTGSAVDPAALRQYFHSAGIDKSSQGSNYYPISIPALDDLLDNMQATADIPTRKQFVKQALDYVIWEFHPVTAIYQTKNPYALDADIRGFHAQRASDGDINVDEMYFETAGSGTFLFASPARFIDMNPQISNSYYDTIIVNPVFSSLYERDNLLNYQPVLASGQPIPIGSEDAISDVIDPSTIDLDSSYYGKTTWGDSPNIDTAQYSATLSAADKSMFLVNLRPDIPWHEGWGYEDANAYPSLSADDMIWTISYQLNDEIPQPNLATYEGLYGTDYTKAIEKINDTMVKINIRGPLGNGLYADYYDALAIPPLPQHVLDPTFDASPYGGSVGVTPDGTTIAAYADHRDYDFNTAAKPVIQCGPFYFVDWSESEATAQLLRFDDWGGSTNSLWNEAPYSNANGITEFGITVIDQVSQAEIALENEEIDGIDYNFQMGRDVPYLESKANIQVVSFVDAGMQTMGYNTYHNKLSNRFVRLAISHVLPREEIVSYILAGLAEPTELLGLAKANPFYPDEEDWTSIGLPESFNTLASDGETMLEFQGHISYNLEKAWALMEMAGYDMSAFRETMSTDTDGGDNGSNDSTGFEIGIVMMSLAVIGFATIRRRR